MNSQQVGALPVLKLEALSVNKIEKPVEITKETTIKEVKKPVEKKVKKVVRTYIIQEGDTLTSIAQNHNIDWIRLWQKNKSLSNQDTLVVGEKLVIPESKEVLSDRPLVTAPEVSRSDSIGKVVQVTTQTPTTSYAASGGANMYTPGYCTWYVKERRPDIGGMWGDANQWLASAQSSGYSTGNEPRAGAIGVSFAGAFGHVVYVESVSMSSIVISDMNGVAGFGAVGSRIATASEFTYIY